MGFCKECKHCARAKEYVANGVYWKCDFDDSQIVCTARPKAMVDRQVDYVFGRGGGTDSAWQACLDFNSRGECKLWEPGGTVQVLWEKIRSL